MQPKINKFVESFNTLCNILMYLKLHTSHQDLSLEEELLLKF